ncbi:uncharacterized protein LOC107473231 [Arachis duranensis]|uniref:Uncharacterized protein LOC107473231 n=1 Tax=Arachis duranensis TaxID=130453 RepID=A0A9C6TAW9_ARADU|nr:uncharacterized protein LOC107473231 [Arachis duranensis]
MHRSRHLLPSSSSRCPPSVVLHTVVFNNSSLALRFSDYFFILIMEQSQSNPQAQDIVVQESQTGTSRDGGLVSWEVTLCSEEHADVRSGSKLSTSLNSQVVQSGPVSHID